jgi:hypothetical protein
MALILSVQPHGSHAVLGWATLVAVYDAVLDTGDAGRLDHPYLLEVEVADPQIVARAWVVQLRLCGRFRRLRARKPSTNIVATAIARELAGFLWAEMTA